MNLLQERHITEPLQGVCFEVVALGRDKGSPLAFLKAGSLMGYIRLSGHRSTKYYWFQNLLFLEIWAYPL